MSPQTILIIILVIIAVNFIWSKTMDYLTLKRLDMEVPDELKNSYDIEKYRKSQAYTRERLKFGMISGVFSTAFLVIVLVFGVMGKMDELVSGFSEDPGIRALLFFGFFYLCIDLISLPFSIYSTFVIEEKYGFNKTKPVTFVADKLKSYLLMIILGGPLLYGLIWLIDSLGQDFWIWFWIAITIILILMNYLFSTLFLPLFNKLTPLEDGELKSAIKEFCAKVNFPIDKVLVMDGSKRSTKSNAFFSGFGKTKRVILYDTLIEKHSDEELLAILAHEVGHYKRKHIHQGFVAGVLNFGLMLFLLSLMVESEALSIALGSPDKQIHLNLVAFSLLYSPISSLIGMGMNLLSRKNEYEADAYASQHYSGKALEKALITLHQENYSNLNPHPVVVWMNYSHPTLIQRIKAIRQLRN